MNITNDGDQARIADTSGSSTSTAPTAAASKGSAIAAGGTAAIASTRGSDQATISSTSGLLQAALSVNDARMEKVAPVKAAIDAGSYSVPSSLVADKVISALTT